MSLIDVTKDNIKDTIEQNELIILDFWAEWCGPCKRFAPIFESVAKKYPEVLFGKINTDLEQEISATFDIKSIPTLAVIKDRDIIFMQPGAVNEEVFEQIVKRAKEVDMEEVRKQNPESPEDR
ncbi:thioredoxin [Bdellovibrio reynosensis]|uniref:Thioredoxin n=1 Tax=Bdellovibrio reynosensis TaxID=2835041 RepID=A0ABY4C9F4_9BACT|nr:thioredoxin [Bdellovibrio reynosensis]UOF00266.1 thioredoxin [Bdellovibrio reynosensis]